MVVVIGRRDDVASAERRSGRNKGLQRRDIDLRGDFDELDVQSRRPVSASAALVSRIMTASSIIG